MEKIPFITSPDVKNVPESEKPDMLDAQKTEQLVYEYKVKQEEMLSIFDEIREYLDYEDILTANTHIQEEGEDGLSNEIQEKISKYLGSLDPNNENHRILFNDFKKLWQENPDLISRALAESIKNRETKKVSDTHLSNGGQVDQEKIDQEVEARTIGKVMKAVYMLNFHFNPLEKELSEMSEDDLERISAYEKANFNKVRNVISEIQEMKEGINSAKSSKNVDVVRKTDEVARIHGTSPDEVKNINTNLEKSLSKIFGKKFSFGIETKFDEMGNIVERDFLTAYVNYHREMKELHQLLNQGRLVETKYVKEIIERALPALKKNPPTVVFFHGDQGTGKTALAVHIARTRFGKEPIIVAGNKYLDPERFTEEFRIQKLDPVDFINQIRKQLNLSEVSKDADPAEVLAEVVGTKDQFRQTVLDNQLREEYKYECEENGEKYSDAGFEKYKSKPKNNSKKIKDTEREVNELFSNGIQGRYMMGAIYLAMKEGRPLIIDEANAISPEVLIAFNDLMTKKLGEKMTTRTDDKEFKIKDGYCVMWTGNTGERFKQARFQNMDPAAFSRIVPIKYGYLPQSREVNNMDTVLKRLDLDKLSDKAFDNNTEAFNAMKESKQQASTDQIFQVMLVKLLNKRLGTELLVKTNDRYSVFKDIYKLSVGARIIMDMFEGKAEDLPEHAKPRKYYRLYRFDRLDERIEKRQFNATRINGQYHRGIS
jgi:MoxR-like ATPase